MPSLELFGSWEDKGHGPVYIVSAKCSKSCHTMTQMLDPVSLDSVDDAQRLLAYTERYVRDAFARVHA